MTRAERRVLRMAVAEGVDSRARYVAVRALSIFEPIAREMMAKLETSADRKGMRLAIALIRDAKKTAERFEWA